MNEPTIYREATDKCVQGYGHSMMDSKCVGCGARNMFVVPVEPCEHKSERFPNGHIDGHYVGADNPRGYEMEWCPGAGIGGGDVAR